MQETWVRSLGQEDPLQEEETLIFLPGKSHGQGNLAGYSPWGCKRVRYDLANKQQNCSYKNTVFKKEKQLSYKFILTYFTASPLGIGFPYLLLYILALYVHCSCFFIISLSSQNVTTFPPWFSTVSGYPNSKIQEMM